MRINSEKLQWNRFCTRLFAQIWSVSDAPLLKNREGNQGPHYKWGYQPLGASKGHVYLYSFRLQFQHKCDQICVKCHQVEWLRPQLGIFAHEKRQQGSHLFFCNLQNCKARKSCQGILESSIASLFSIRHQVGDFLSKPQGF